MKKNQDLSSFRFCVLCLLNCWFGFFFQLSFFFIFNFCVYQIISVCKYERELLQLSIIYVFVGCLLLLNIYTQKLGTQTPDSTILL